MAKLAASGDMAKLAASGDMAKLAASGDRAKLAASGKFSIAAGIGIQNKVSISDQDSWIVIADYLDNKSIRVIAVKPGDVVDKIIIEVDTYYWFENGKLYSEKDG
jgi:hypothetical protein